MKNQHELEQLEIEWSPFKTHVTEISPSERADIIWRRPRKKYLTRNLHALARLGLVATDVGLRGVDRKVFVLCALPGFNSTSFPVVAVLSEHLVDDVRILSRVAMATSMFNSIALITFAWILIVSCLAAAVQFSGVFFDVRARDAVLLVVVSIVPLLGITIAVSSTRRIDCAVRAAVADWL